jgi:hypothetical protein
MRLAQTPRRSRRRDELARSQGLVQLVGRRAGELGSDDVEAHLLATGEALESGIQMGHHRMRRADDKVAGPAQERLQLTGDLAGEAAALLFFVIAAMVV